MSFIKPICALDKPDFMIRASYEKFNIWESDGKNELENIIEIGYKLYQNKEVSLGGTILQTYRYRRDELTEKNIEKNYSINIKETNRDLYPLEFLKLEYNGYDVSGNIILRVYIGSLNNETSKQIYNRINNINNKDKNNRIFSVFNVLSYYYNGYDYKEYIVDPSKVIFFDKYMIPPFQITTNKETSKIDVEIEMFGEQIY